VDSLLPLRHGLGTPSGTLDDPALAKDQDFARRAAKVRRNCFANYPEGCNYLFHADDRRGTAAVRLAQRASGPLLLKAREEPAVVGR